MAGPYFVCSGAEGTGAGTSWVNAYVSIPAAMTGATLAGGEIVYVHNTHAYLAGAAITWTLPEATAGVLQVLCVDGGDAAFTSDGAAMGTTVGNLATGGSESTNGNFAFTVGAGTSPVTQQLYCYGMTIKTGAAGSSSAADINLGGDSVYQNCTVFIDSTSGGAVLTAGTNSSGNKNVFRECTFTFGTTGQGILIFGGDTEFVGCKQSGTAPTTLFSQGTGGRGQHTLVQNCDFSASTNLFSVAQTNPGWFRAVSSAIGTPATGTHAGPGGPIIECMACAAVGGSEPKANILAYYYQDFWGVVENDATVYLTSGGALGEQSDGTDTPYSLKMSPSSACTKHNPLFTPWINVMVGSTGDKTVALKIATTRAAALTSSDVFMQVSYMGEPGATGTQRVADSPMSVIEVDDDCPVITGTINRDVLAAGTNRTDTSVAWTGVTETETNTLTASINCAEIGYIRCRIGLGSYAAGATNPVYVDPKISVT